MCYEIVRKPLTKGFATRGYALHGAEFGRKQKRAKEKSPWFTRTFLASPARFERATFRLGVVPNSALKKLNKCWFSYINTGFFVNSKTVQIVHYVLTFGHLKMNVCEKCVKTRLQNYGYCLHTPVVDDNIQQLNPVKHWIILLFVFIVITVSNRFYSHRSIPAVIASSV